MMKKIGILILVFMLGVSGFAQTKTGIEKNNYVVSTSKIPQLEPIILTAEALKQEDGHNFGDFQIVLYGQNVKELTNKEKMSNYIKKTKAAGVEIKVCKLSINYLKIDKKDLHPYIKVVDHAFTHLLQLQKNKNYYSIEL
jgi:intracellular sulfur oxidation DsrE/DsrF family protein